MLGMDWMQRRRRIRETEDQVLLIRNEYKPGHITQKTLSTLYGVSHQTISKIVTYKIWTWL